MWNAFLEAMRELDYEEGRNLVGALRAMAVPIAYRSSLPASCGTASMSS
jgi:hypothetical protein